MTHNKNTVADNKTGPKSNEASNPILPKRLRAILDNLNLIDRYLHRPQPDKIQEYLETLSLNERLELLALYYYIEDKLETITEARREARRVPTEHLTTHVASLYPFVDVVERAIQRLGLWYDRAYSIPTQADADAGESTGKDA